MKRNIDSHIFALHAPQHYQPLANYAQQKTITIIDKDFYFRLTTVLRLNVGESFIMFDHHHSMTCTLQTITKKEITISILNFSENKKYSPTITCCIPLLKREALETFADIATQLGATTIQLILTKKAHRSTLDTKDYERLQRVIYAAAEQSKNFSYPIVKAPIPLSNVAYQHTLFFDPLGSSSFDIISSFASQQSSDITLITGPEGDLTEQEKEYLHSQNVIFMALTPTIMRAEQAAALGLGIFRSLLSNRN
jgi:16S rRNA (uracil1498-N3)-methyltransferase